MVIEPLELVILSLIQLQLLPTLKLTKQLIKLFKPQPKLESIISVNMTFIPSFKTFPILITKLSKHFLLLIYQPFLFLFSSFQFLLEVVSPYGHQKSATSL